MTSYLIPNLANACRMFELVARSSHGLGLSEIEQQLAIPRTTAFRILQTLCHQQILSKQGRKYVTGPALYQLGLDLVNHHPLHRHAVAQLKQLAMDTGLSAQLLLPRSNGALVGEVIDNPNPYSTAARPGFCAALNCSAAGKLFLANLHLDKLNQFAEHFETQTAQSITDLSQLRVELQRILARGYATDEQEYREGIRCLAAPVRDERGVVVAAIGVTGPIELFPLVATAQVAALVKQAALTVALSTYRPELLANAQ